MLTERDALQRRGSALLCGDGRSTSDHTHVPAREGRAALRATARNIAIVRQASEGAGARGAQACRCLNVDAMGSRSQAAMHTFAYGSPALRRSPISASVLTAPRQTKSIVQESRGQRKDLGRKTSP